MSNENHAELKRQFQNPSDSFGPVDTWWWEAAPVTREKITEQLEQLKAQGRTIESFGDPQLIAIPGGVTVLKDGAVVGAMAVGGLPSGIDDEVIAKAGLNALNL